jgi:hypothetical protein
MPVDKHACTWGIAQTATNAASMFLVTILIYCGVEMITPVRSARMMTYELAGLATNEHMSIRHAYID